MLHLVCEFSHYDVAPDLYESFLDREMVYTCGFFDGLDIMLAEAQQRKLSLVLERLRLAKPDARVLEIGCGWGSFSRHFVRAVSEARYVGLTISTSQVAHARQLDGDRLSAQQRSRVEYRLEDYLDHEAPGDGYDGVVVIGMMEHVGLGDYPTFVRSVCRFLRPGSRAVIHTILSPKSGEPTNSWIDRHIFHGGYAPSIAEVARAAEGACCELETVFTHAPENYRQTIECWIENLIANWTEFRDGHLADWSDADADALYRTWYFYLCGVRNMFVPGAMGFRIAHFVIKKA